MSLACKKLLESGIPPETIYDVLLLFLTIASYKNMEETVDEVLEAATAFHKVHQNR